MATLGLASSPAHAAVDYAGCRSGYVCIYPDASWNNSRPEHDYYTYGVHQLYDEFGVHRVFNNQTGGAVVRLCTDRAGRNCTASMGAFLYEDINLTPYNSIKLSTS
ncbi:hypothetical protein [Streptomyces clavuligerus]|uniref:hypothetical protein n=1 Tax=Streptomyces clavuligerus TaxID=1901 RepID=UPI001EEF7739|nr:hypothetical protein [Streptomyces clavuligerus]